MCVWCLGVQGVCVCVCGVCAMHVGCSVGLALRVRVCVCRCVACRVCVWLGCFWLLFLVPCSFCSQVCRFFPVHQSHYCTQMSLFGQFPLVYMNPSVFCVSNRILVHRWLFCWCSLVPGSLLVLISPCNTYINRSCLLLYILLYLWNN